jgi:hypothetical protein
MPVVLATASTEGDEALYTLSDYEQVLVKNNADLVNATNAEINDYVDIIREFRNGLDPYQQTYMEAIDELSEVSLAIDKAVADGEIDAETASKIQQEVLFTKLEGWGITTTEKIDEDVKSWMDKAIAFKESEDKKTTNTSGGQDGSTTQYVHTGNLALKINSVMWLPCWEWNGIPINCPVIDGA